MGDMKFFEKLIDNKMRSLHTAYLAKVLEVNGSTAKIQPLGLVGSSILKPQSTLSAVPILRSAQYQIRIDGETVVAEPLSAGRVVLCVCCERDITNAKKGLNTATAEGRYSMSDSIIVGVL